jgi:hypothetical protein
MIENLKDLEKLLKLCRKQGVTEIATATVTLKFGDMPQERSTQAINDPADPYANFPQSELSPTQLAFYSSGGDPNDDPENIQ